MRCVLVLSWLLTFLAFVLSVIAIAIPYWQYASSPDEKYQGLWQTCNERKGGCKLILMPPEALDAVRVMMLFGMILYLIACILVFVYMFIQREKGSLVNGALFLTTFGGIFCFIAVVVYGVKYTFLLDSRGTALHAGFGLAVVSTIMGFVCTLMYCLAKARDEVD